MKKLNSMLSRFSYLVLWALLVVSAVQPVMAAPANDNFANAQALAGQGGTVNGTNVDATQENGEPTHYNSGVLPSGFITNAGKSVWYQWTAPVLGNASVQSTADFGPMMVIYTGTALGTLSKVSTMSTIANKVYWRATPGTTYYIVLDSLFYFTNGQAQPVATGPFSLAWNMAPAPPNDNFANFITVNGTAGQTTGNNLGAYKEDNEPFTITRDSSMWYRWTAPANGSVVFDTEGSVFDTALNVFTGTAINALTQIAQDNDGGTDNLSKMPFTVVGGTTYSIAVGGYSASFEAPRGNFTLKWAFANAPVNDNFANAITMTPATAGTVNGNNVGAGQETGEPDPTFSRGNQSIWYNWTAPASGVVTMDTAGSSFDTYLSIYTGTQVNGLTSVNENDNDLRNPAIKTSKVKFTVVAGTTYRVRVDNAASGSSSEASITYPETHGPITVNWAFINAPANDNFANAIAMTPATAGTVNGTNVGASQETGEPDPTFSRGDQSIWYKWTAPADGVVTMDTQGSTTTTGAEFNTYLSVYTGTQVNGLTSVSENDNDLRSAPLKFSKLKFTAVSGTTYYVRVDNAASPSTSDSSLSYDETRGSITVNWALVNAPVNDDFVNAIAMTPATAGTVNGTNVGASQETGEPDPTFSRGDQSIWYKWTAPADGVVTMDTQGSKTTTNADYNTYLSVYTGTQVNGLTSVAENDDDLRSAPLKFSKLKFTAVSGTTYFVRVDNAASPSTSDSSLSYDETRGMLTVNWGFVNAPVNDDFVNSIALTPAGGKVQGTNVGASQETGEPDPTFSRGDQSIWYKWTAPADGVVTMDTQGSKTTTNADYNTYLSIYTGAQVNALTSITENDDDFRSNPQKFSKLKFTAASGTTYHVRVDNAASPSTSDSSLSYDETRGMVTLSWGFVAAPANDDFANSIQLIPANAGRLEGTNVGASQETGEPDPTFSRGNQSIWYKWTAPGAGSVTFTTAGSKATTNADHNTYLSVYTGGTLPGLAVVGENDNDNGLLTSKVTFTAQGGTVYMIRVDNAASPSTSDSSLSYDETHGTVVLDWSFGGAPIGTPTITSFTPGSGNAGTSVTLNGTGFTGATAVQFNGVNGTITSVGATQIVATAPTGVTTGRLSVVTPNGTGTSATDFLVPPTITNFTPTSGSVGTNVTINGTGFTGVTSVKFNGVEATFGVNSLTQIVTTVPAGALTGTISVTTSGGTAVSGTSFTINAPGSLSFSSASYSINETGGTATITVTRTGGSAGAVAVTYATSDGTAIAGSDYTAKTGTLTWADGDAANKTFTVTIGNDARDEANETITLTLSNPTGGASLGANTSATLSITDDDATPQLSIADAGVTEGNTGTKQLSFTITLSAPSGQAVSVSYTTADNTANAGTDYTAVPTTQVTFAPGELTKTFTVTIAGDTTVEATESFFVNLTAPTNATLSDAQASGTITTDDAAAPGSLSFSSATYSVNEAAGTSTITVTRTGGSDGAVAVNYATSNGTGTAGSDYTAKTGTLSFAAGVTSQTFTVTIANDTADEADETINLTLSNATGGATIGTPSSAQLTILDNDAPANCSNVFTDSDLESAAPHPAWTVQTSTAFGTPFCDGACGDGGGTAGPQSGVQWAWFGGTETAETATLGRTVTLPAGATVTLSFGMRLSASAPFNDTLSVKVDGTTVQTYTEPGTSEAGYTIRTVNLSAYADGAAHTIVFEYTGVGGVGNVANFNVDDIELEVCTAVTPSSLSFSVAAYSVNESAGTATITVQRTANTTGTSTVNYATSNGTATAGSDYTAKTGTLTFAAGVASQTFTVAITNDTLAEANETITLTLSSPGNGVLGTPATSTLTIVDNDTPATVPTIAINDITVTESNGGSAQAAFTLTLSAPSTKTVTVIAQTTSSGSPAATAGADYTNMPPTTISIAPGQTSKTVSVTILGDTLDESDEKFGVNLSGVTNATVADSAGVCTILDNDDAPLISVSAPNSTEGSTGETATMSFTIKLAAASARNISVQYQTANSATFPATGNADYTAIPLTTVIFLAGETTKTVNVTVKGDLLDEDNERIKLNLSNPVNATVGTISDGIIVDDDATPSLSINDLSVNEGQTGTKLMNFTVTLSAASGRTVMVNTATGNGGTPAATAGTDYLTLASTPLTFAPGQTTKQVSITIYGDTTVEVNEKVGVILSGAVNATLADNSGIGTILNDDAPQAPAPVSSE